MGIYCIAFIEYMLAGKTLLDYTNLFSANDYKKNDKIIYKYFKDNMVEEESLEFRLKKIDETRNYLLDEIKHNDLMCERYKKSIMTKKKKKHNKIVLIGKDKLNIIEVLISKSLIDSYISNDKFVSVNNVLREFNEMKKEIRNPKTSVEYNT